MSKPISDWDREKYLQLIQLYEQNPILWDAQNAQHFNKNLKNDAWLSIANQMDEDEDIVRKKMNSLNGSFRREKSKTKNSMRTGKGRDEIYKSKWFGYEHMQFLNDKDEPRKTINIFYS
ncbi:uncharacterized protein LOC132952911 [Metopolophium dirhodum]|uniref:uncharacterized protein LOC132952911 n=1 Tax=Metopolophium dirhodum TaxID=44670 RepID=UPI0029902F8D|nr:uncharacterized protein LOC132952911 [Metopolophium dirhodum]